MGASIFFTAAMIRVYYVTLERIPANIVATEK
jgi:hypothetical protein